MFGKMGIAALLPIVGVSMSTNAAIITSWENVDAAGGGTYDTVGVTDGAKSVKYSMGAGFDSKTLYQPIAPNTFLSAVNVTKKLYIDVTASAMTGSPAPAITDFHFVLQVIGAGTTNYNSPNFASSLGTGAVTGQTLVWDVTALNLPVTATLVFLKAEVTENKTRTVNFDRLATTAAIAVPEPATMGVLGLTSLAALGRTRRRQS